MPFSAGTVRFLAWTTGGGALAWWPATAALFGGNVTGWAFMPNGDDLLATIEAVHAAGLDSSEWPRALAAVAETLGGHAAMFEVFDKRAACHREWHGFGVPPAAEIAYFEHYVADN